MRSGAPAHSSAGPGTATTRPRALAAPGTTLVLASGAVGVLYATGGRDLGPLATCWFHAGTGLWCPFCGSLRAVAALSHGRVLDALSFNLPVVLLLPLVGALWVQRFGWATRGRVVEQPRVGNRGLLVLGSVMLAFAVLRNTPYGAWLAP